MTAPHRFCHRLVAIHDDLELHWSIGRLPHAIRRRRGQFGQLRDFKRDRHRPEHTGQHFLNFFRHPDNNQRNHHLDHQPGRFFDRPLRHHHGLRSASSSTGFVASHSIILTGLIASTTYHYQVQATNTVGNYATSTDQTFTTSSTGPDTTSADGAHKSHRGRVFIQRT